MKKSAETILFITRTEKDLPFLRPLLEREGYVLHPVLSLSADETLPGPAAQIIIDLNFDISRLDDTLQWCREHYPGVDPLLLSPLTADSLAPFVSVLPRIIIKKPFSAEELIMSLGRSPASSPSQGKSPLIRDGSFLSASPKMEAVYELVRQVAPTDAFVLIRGETGTGKEVITRLIHRMSLRHSEKLVTINCAALPESLLESELFGYEKGAFTGATESKPGKFEYAHKGTLLLDEIGDMALPLQAKVLRVLQEKEVERLGSHEKKKADVRVVSATHQPLEELMERGLFREDLYYRLNVISVHLPPLRERPEDIILLSDSFLEEFTEKYRKEIQGFSSEVRDFFLRYLWPGNVRELRNLVESMVILTRKRVITEELLPASMKEKTRKLYPSSPAAVQESPLSLESVEEGLIRQALDKTRGNRAQAARILGIARSTLYNKMEKYGLS